MHVHSHYSDGVFSPKELIDMALSKGLDGIALTDHDTINGIDEIIEYAEGKCIVIPAIEFSTEHLGEEVHILGYFIDYRDKELIRFTEKLKRERLIRTKKILENLKSINIDISEKELYKQVASDFVGRPHIARAMIAKNYADNLSDAFNNFLVPGKPGYVERYKIPMTEAIELIHSLNGIAILAHPGLLNNQSIVYDAISRGIDGIECVHSLHKPEDIMKYKKITKENKLLETAGSDFHDYIYELEEKNILGEYYIEIDSLEYFNLGG